MAAAHVSEAIAEVLKIMIFSYGKVYVFKSPEETWRLLFKTSPSSVQTQKTEICLEIVNLEKIQFLESALFGR